MPTKSIKVASPTEQLLRKAFGPLGGVKLQTRKERLEAKLLLLREEAERLKNVKTDNLFGFEKKIRSELGERRTEVDGKISSLETQLKQMEKHINMAKAGYPEQLDLTSLALAGKNGPRFMVFDIADQQGKLEIEIQKLYPVITFKPHLPNPIEEQLCKASSNLIARAKREDREFTASAVYEGVVPETARQAIRKAQASRLFSQIFVIAEVPEWKLLFWPDSIEGDPIVIGWVGETEQAFLITVFDPTSLEQYVREQFAFGTTIPPE